MSWTPIPGHESYLVSKQGLVMSLDYQRSGTPAILRPQKSVGYSKVTLAGSRKRISVHSLVLLAFVGPRPDGMQINHKNGIKTDNRLENLEYCTPSANIRHAFKAGLKIGPRGERQGHAKLTAEKVQDIRRLLKAGVMHKDIARKYDVSRVAITNINMGVRWAHLPVEGGVPFPG